MAEMSGGPGLNEDGSPAGGSGVVLRMDEMSSDEDRSNKPSEDVRNTNLPGNDRADSLLADSSSLMDEEPSVATESPCSDTERVDSGYTLDSSCTYGNVAENVDRTTGDLPSETFSAGVEGSIPPSSQLCYTSPSPAAQPSDVPFLMGPEGEHQPTAMEEATAVVIGDDLFLAAALMDEPAEPGIRNIEEDEMLPGMLQSDEENEDDSQERINIHVERLQNTMDVEDGNGQGRLIHDMDAALHQYPAVVGPPTEQYYMYHFYVDEYIASLPDDLMDFMDFRTRTEEEENRPVREIRGETQPVEVSLESRRQDYVSHLRRAILVDLIRSNDPVEKLLALYATDPDAYKKKIHVGYFDETKDPGYDGHQPMEEGIDQNGMTKDLFANMFRALIDRFEASVPLCIGYSEGKCSGSRCECMLLAMVCIHGYLLTGQVPKYLPKLFVMGMFCSDDNVTDDFLVSMVNIFTEDQVPYVKQAIYRYREDNVQDEDIEHLHTLAESYDRPLPPRDPKEFEEWLKALVLASGIKKPSHFVSIFKQYRESISILERAMPSDAQQIWNSLRPTRTDILHLLSPKYTHQLVVDPIEYTAFESLQSFLTTSEESLAVKFLLFCTGSESLTVREIEVEFYQGKGYPVASTCSNSVRIPTGHDQYDEFQERMIVALAHPGNYHFHRA